MASVGLLLLMMMSAFFIISSVTTSPSADQSEGKSLHETLRALNQELKSKGKGALRYTGDIKDIGQTGLTLIRDIGNAMKDSSSDILQVAQSLVAVVPVVGSVFSLLMTLVIVIDKHVNDKSLLKDIKEEFDKLDAKLDQHHMEQEWKILAAGVYQKPEMNIRLAWNEYKTLLSSLAEAKNDAEKKDKHIKSYIESYRKYENAPRKMGELLKIQGKSFISNLGEELAKHVKCHEKEILEYTLLILTLIVKGNKMNEFYYKLEGRGDNTKREVMKRNVYDAMTAMFDIQKRCIADSMTYVLQDVKPMIEKSEKRDDLAKKVRSFLNEAYYRYDWTVVAFITLKSSHKIFKAENKHVLTGFHSVSTERITVAVARQVKGTHSRAQKVGEAIKNCFPKKALCYEVAETLSKCGEEVAGIPGIAVNETYTAVHAYIKKAHQSTEAKEANPKVEAQDNGEEDDEVNGDPENPSAQTPYIYTGDCKKFPGAKHGKFVVLIKSDEEMLGKDPCANMDCKNGGKCIPIADMFLAMCQCNYPHYGLYCESDINDYGIELKEEAATERKKPVVIDSRARNRN